MNYGLLQKRKTGQKALMALLCLMVCSYATPKVPSEYDVKLVYLYNFTRFIQWPNDAFSDSESPYAICVLGDIPSKDSALQLQKKRSRNRPISIQFLESNNETDNCHILFITKSVEFTTMNSIIREASENTLTIGESPGFAKHSGEIGFMLDNRNRVRVEINLHRAQQKKFDIRAKLLEIARKIYREGDT